ncbi:MAG TPA: serine/threonine-protein kinase [Minicystis sp.]|nr:serine/threonine-protein kinase [Minicystis sp.]
MLELLAGDDELKGLSGTTIPSEVAPGVSYAVGIPLGSGGLSVAFSALRLSPEGTCPVALKFLRPSFLRRYGESASLVVKREAVALGRLNERVPATPFVVRLLDTGEFEALLDKKRLRLPFIVTEYIHGGPEGATLYDRVTQTLRATGAAFDPARAVRAIEAIGNGLAAVHEVGVTHRNLTPNNVLCCGSLDEEMFKIADFGLARPKGLPGTVSGMMTGTPGYAAPELGVSDGSSVGPWSDVFSFAAVVFFLLTGEPYFDAASPGDAIAAALASERRSIRGTLGIHPRLADNERACKAIDSVLAWASCGKPEARLQEVLALSAMLAPHLKATVDEAQPISSPVPAGRALSRRPTVDLDAWVWTTLKSGGHGFDVIRSVGWDGDGRCLAATSEGLAFWNGTAWQAARTEGLPRPKGIRFVSRVDAGRWLVGGDASTLALYTTGGVTSRWQIPDPTLRFERLSGDLADVAVLVSVAPDGPTKLHALVGRRWLKPLLLEDVAMLTSIARVEDTRWLLAGRGHDGQAFAGLYSPLDWEVERVPAPHVRAFIAAAGLPSRGLGLAVGAAGAVLWREPGGLLLETIHDGHDVSACAIDSEGRGFAASAGRIYRRQGKERPAWVAIWSDPSWTTPIVSLFAEPDLVLAVTADGGVIEGRRGI